MNRAIRLILTAAVAGSLIASAQEAGDAPQIAAANVGDYGTVLTDGAGISLYTFTLDDGATACDVDCGELWEPVLAGAEPTAGNGAAASLIGTIQLADGTSQVTYYELPLFRNAQDGAAGDANGHGVSADGRLWHLVSPYGAVVEVAEPEVEESAPSEASEETEAVLSPDELLTLGETVFANTCAACHGEQGEGFVGPELDGNERLSGADYVIGIVRGGSGGMPGFGSTLSNTDIAAVVSYVRSSWSNDYGTVTQDAVAR